MKFLNNFKNPQGKFGDKIIDQMNDKNTQVGLWGISHFDIVPTDTILDIGCGGGTIVKEMAQSVEDGKVYGVDYSQKSVERATDYNKEMISKNKVEIIEASVSNLPFEDKTFNTITAIKTVFFWPDLINDFKEVKRVLKDEGKFVIVADYNANGGKIMKFAEKLMEMDPISDVETTNLLNQAGFSNVTTYIRELKNKKEIIKKNNIKEDEINDAYQGKAVPSDKMSEWICIIAEK